MSFAYPAIYGNANAVLKMTAFAMESLECAKCFYTTQ